MSAPLGLSRVCHPRGASIKRAIQTLLYKPTNQYPYFKNLNLILTKGRKIEKNGKHLRQHILVSSSY